MKTVTVEQWVSKIESMDGVCFHHMGRNRHGVDCYGLLIAAAEELGIADERLYEVKGYRRLPGTGLLEGNIENFLQKRPYNRLQPLHEQARLGDILIFYIDDADNPRHMAVYLGRYSDNLNYMMHADARQRKVVKTRLDASIWKARLKSVWYSPRIIEA